VKTLGHLFMIVVYEFVLLCKTFSAAVSEKYEELKAEVHSE